MHGQLVQAPVVQLLILQLMVAPAALSHVSLVKGPQLSRQVGKQPLTRSTLAAKVPISIINANGIPGEWSMASRMAGQHLEFLI